MGSSARKPRRLSATTAAVARVMMRGIVVLPINLFLIPSAELACRLVPARAVHTRGSTATSFDIRVVVADRAGRAPVRQGATDWRDGATSRATDYYWSNKAGASARATRRRSSAPLPAGRCRSNLARQGRRRVRVMPASTSPASVVGPDQHGGGGASVNFGLIALSPSGQVN